MMSPQPIMLHPKPKCWARLTRHVFECNYSQRYLFSKKTWLQLNEWKLHCVVGSCLLRSWTSYLRSKINRVTPTALAVFFICLKKQYSVMGVTFTAPFRRPHVTIRFVCSLFAFCNAVDSDSVGSFYTATASDGAGQLFRQSPHRTGVWWMGLPWPLASCASSALSQVLLPPAFAFSHCLILWSVLPVFVPVKCIWSMSIGWSMLLHDQKRRVN